MSLSPKGARFVRQATHPILFPLWLLYKLPSALFCGIRVRELSEARCRTRVPFGWRSQNPFQSIYFAAQAMAAELSTGALVMLATGNEEGSFSTLIVESHSRFGKKASQEVIFTCEAGPEVFAAVAEAKASGQPRTITVETVGRLPDGAEASRFTYTWSIKRRG